MYKYNKYLIKKILDEAVEYSDFNCVISCKWKQTLENVLHE